VNAVEICLENKRNHLRTPDFVEFPFLVMTIWACPCHTKHWSTFTYVCDLCV